MDAVWLLSALTSGKLADTYGIELDEVRGEEAENCLDRVGFGSLLLFKNKQGCVPSGILKSSVSFCYAGGRKQSKK